MVKVNIISGFLGAGKTTLIKKLLNEVFIDDKIVLIENEFGEIGVDNTFLQDSGIEIEQIYSGCICCSLVGDFKEAMKSVISKFNPDRIIIEPSGVGKLSDVKDAVKQVEDVIMDNSIVVVDVKKYMVYKRNFPEFFNDQIENADCIILSRTQLSDNANVEDVYTHIKKQNNHANIITTDWDQLNSEVIKQAISNKGGHTHSETCACGHDHHHHHNQVGEEEHHHESHCCSHDEHHHADDVFESWGVETPHQYSEAKLTSILNALMDFKYGQVLRAKGVVASEKGWLHFDMLPQEIEIRSGGADYIGKICVIGTDLDEARLKELFDLR